MKKQISENVIQRLPKYYRYLKELIENGTTCISSKKISEALNITASQVRQDLSLFGEFGQQGYGYDTEHLKKNIQDILGLNKKHSAIIVGGGRIGQALASYGGFAQENVSIKAIFDIEVSHIAVKENLEVLEEKELENYLKNNKIDIVIISVQKEIAESVAKRVIKCGIKSIWNFAPIDLRFDGNVVCENINMSESLMRLIYKSKRFIGDENE